MHLSVTHRIEILVIIKFDDRVRTQQKVIGLLNTKYSDMPMTQSAVSKVERKFRETGTVHDRSQVESSKINEAIKFNILIAMEENTPNSLRRVCRY